MKTKQIELVYHPHPALTTAAEPVTEITHDVRVLALSMIRIVMQHRGLGLAANQVGVSVRMFVAASPVGYQIYINPELVHRSSLESEAKEGCLSHPGVIVKVRRADCVRMRYQDTNGREHESAASDLIARCWQHEIDHLNGISIIDKEGKGHP